MERKYRQRGYSDREAEERSASAANAPSGRRSRRVPSRTCWGRGRREWSARSSRARCSNCGAVLAPGFDLNRECPRCHFELHSCKQCVHFDTGKQFECTQPIPERIAKKDAKNDCTFFEFRITVEKDTSPVNYASAAPVATTAARPNDARKAFEDLFKK